MTKTIFPKKYLKNVESKHSDLLGVNLGLSSLMVHKKPLLFESYILQKQRIGISPYQPVPCRLFWIPWSEMASPGYLLWQHQSRGGSGLNQRLPHIRGQGLSSSGHQGHRSTWQTWETSDWEVLKANYMSRIKYQKQCFRFEKKHAHHIHCHPCLVDLTPPCARSGDFLPIM